MHYDGGIYNPNANPTHRLFTKLEWETIIKSVENDTTIKHIDKLKLLDILWKQVYGADSVNSSNSGRL